MSSCLKVYPHTIATSLEKDRKNQHPLSMFLFPSTTLAQPLPYPLYKSAVLLAASAVKIHGCPP